MSAHTPRETAAAPSLQLSSLFAFLIVALATLTGFRLASLVGFGDWQTLAMRRDEIAALLFLGLRFDLKVLSISAFALYSLPALALGWRIAPGGFRRWLRVSFMTLLILFALLGCIDIGYRIFFGAPIDVQIFGFIEDDTLAVISALISDLRLVSLYALFALLVALLVAAYRRIERLPLAWSAGRRRFFALQALIALVFLILGRGSFDTFPLRTANASVSNDAFINSLILNSPYNLFEAFEDRRRSALRQKPAEILKEAQAPDVATLLRRAGYRDQDDLLAVTTPKPGACATCRHGADGRLVHRDHPRPRPRQPGARRVCASYRRGSFLSPVLLQRLWHQPDRRGAIDEQPADTPQPVARAWLCV